MDIDIDCKSDFTPLEYFDVVPASMVQRQKLVKHPCGVYFQHISTDPITDLAAIPYDQAEQFGYMKVDFLHLSVLDWFENKNEIKVLLQLEPDWNILLDSDSVKKLFHIHKHFDLISQVKPTSVVELADCIALIRPGKRQLLNSYIQNKQEVRKFLYIKTKNQYSFKKSHAIAYALTIVLQLHLIKEGIL